MHILGLQAIDGVEVVSVCNRSRESSQRLADQFGIPTIHDQWWEVIDDPENDAIVIGVVIPPLPDYLSSPGSQ